MRPAWSGFRMAAGPFRLRQVTNYETLSLGRYTDIDGGLTHSMKILLDEMCDGWHDRLQLCEHDVSSVVRLRRQDYDLPNDHAVIAYARDNGMVLVTKDNRCGRDCKAAGVPYILLDDEEMFRVLLARLKGLVNPADKMGASDAYT